MEEILWLTGIVFSVVIFCIAIAYLILRRTRDIRNRATWARSPKDVYERYLKGEITIDQYQEMRAEFIEQTPENIAEKFSRFL